MKIGLLGLIFVQSCRVKLGHFPLSWSEKEKFSTKMSNFSSQKNLFGPGKKYPGQSHTKQSCLFMYKKTDCYVCPSYSHTDLATNSGKVLNSSLTWPTPTYSGSPKLQKLSRSLEEKLCVTKNVQMGTLILFSQIELLKICSPGLGIERLWNGTLQNGYFNWVDISVLGLW